MKSESPQENLLSIYARYVEGTESPDSFHIWSLITVVGYLMGRKTWLQPGNRASVQYPRLYTVLVAPPGAARKSFALDQVVRFVREMKLPTVAESTTKEALIEFAAAHEVEHEITVGPDEAIILKHNDILLAASEFSVFLREKRTNNNTVMLLNAWYDCPKDFAEKTIGRGTIDVAGVFMPLLAATTADALAQSLSQSDIEGGIASRILFVVERTAKGRIPFDGPTPSKIKAEADIAARLAQIHEFYCGEMKFSKAAYQFYREWYVGERYDKGISHPRLAYYISRKQNHFFAASMICQALMGLSMTVSLEAAQLAVSLLESIEPNMPLAFAGVSSDDKDPALKMQQRILGYVARYKSGVTLRELFIAFASEVRFENMEIAVDHLISAKQFMRESGKIKIYDAAAVKARAAKKKAEAEE